MYLKLGVVVVLDGIRVWVTGNFLPLVHPVLMPWFPTAYEHVYVVVVLPTVAVAGQLNVPVSLLGTEFAFE